MNKKKLQRLLRGNGFFFPICIIIMCLWFPLLVSGQTRIFLREKDTGSTVPHANVGDTIAIEVVVNLDTVNTEGADFFLTFDDTYFSIVDQGNDSIIHPFDFTGGLFGDQWIMNDTHGDLQDTSNAIAKFQLDGSIILNTGFREGEGMVAVFYLRAIANVESSLISIDYDLGNHRDTKIFPQSIAPASVPFDFTSQIYVSAGTVTSISERKLDVVPEDFNLRQNYPNPFNPETIISYSVPAASEVTVTIYNVTGQIIRTLVSAYQPAGVYEVRWDGKSNDGESASSGVYIYALTAGTHRISKKMLLLR